MALSQNNKSEICPITPGNTPFDSEHQHQLDYLVKQVHDALLTKKETKTTECSLQTFQQLLLRLVIPSRETIVSSDIPELLALQKASSRVGVLWLSSVPWQKPAGEDDDGGRSRWESLSACGPSLELDIRCPIFTTSADMFLSSTFVHSQKNIKNGRASTVSQLVLSAKELMRENYPVPLPGKPVLDCPRSIKVGKFNYSFIWDKKRFVTFYNNFETCPKVSDNAPLFAIDCEMVKTEDNPMALARISVVDQSGHCVYDTFVKPPGRVRDHMARYSGITADMLRNVRTVLSDVQSMLIHNIPKDAILVGQSLEGDLCALGFAHPYIIDTSLIFVPAEWRRKPSLALLAKDILGIDMRRGPMGHDSVADARTALELVLAKVSASHRLLLGTARPRVDTFFDVLSNFRVPSLMVDSYSYVDDYAPIHPVNLVTEKIKSDTHALCFVSHFERAKFGWMQMHIYESLFQPLKSWEVKPSVEKKGMQVDKGIGYFLEYFKMLPSVSLCAIVFGGSLKSDKGNFLRSILFINRNE